MKTDDVKCYIDDEEVDCETWKDNPMRNELLLLLKNNAYRKGDAIKQQDHCPSY